MYMFSNQKVCKFMLYIDREVNMDKLSLVPEIAKKVPRTFIGALIGLVIGGMGGAIFANIGYAEFIPWEEIFLAAGTLFGGILGYIDE